MTDIMHAWGRELARELYQRYAGDLNRLRRFDPMIPTIGKSYAGEERRLLYLMTRFFSPTLIVEFSPKRGWSTLHMAAALEDNGQGHIVSFELDPVYAALTRRTIKNARLTHRVKVIVGDVREEFPEVYAGLQKTHGLSGLEFLFIDSDHSAQFARWYLANVFPLVKQNGAIHVHDIEASPERLVSGEAIAPGPTGEAITLAQHLVQHPERYKWLSLAELVRDTEYLVSVNEYGGGDLSFPNNRAHLHPTDRAIGFERNPSLWILKVGPQETDAYPDLPFEPLQRNAVERLAYGARKRLAFCYAPLREMRRSLRRKVSAGETAAPRRSQAN